MNTSRGEWGTSRPNRKRKTTDCGIHINYSYIREINVEGAAPSIWKSRPNKRRNVKRAWCHTSLLNWASLYDSMFLEYKGDAKHFNMNIYIFFSDSSCFRSCPYPLIWQLEFYAGTPYNQLIHSKAEKNRLITRITQQ